MKFHLPNRCWTHTLVFLFLLFWPFHYFQMTQYASLPWWQEVTNDIDATHAVTTLGLLNNSEYTYVYHPGATLFSIHGSVYRTLAFFSDSCRPFLHVDDVRRFERALEILSSAVITSRWINLATVVAFLILLYALIYQYSRSIFLALGFSLFIGTSTGILGHVTMIRTEIVTLVFFYAALLWTLVRVRRQPLGLRDGIVCFIGAGFFLSAAVFAKVQIVPAVVAFIVGTAGCILLGPDRASTGWPRQRLSPACAGLSVLTLLFCPWWAFSRPDFLTDSFLSQLNPHSDLPLVYGSAPYTLVGYPLALLVFFTFLSVLVWAGERKGKAWTPKLGAVVLSGQAMIVGFILSVYVILAPVSRTFSRYIANTHHLVYATLSNIVSHRYLSQPSLRDADFHFLQTETFHKIFSRLAWADLAGIPLGILVLLVGLMGVIWFFRRTESGWKEHALVMLWLALAFGMDALSLLRDPAYKGYYFIYTITFYGTAVAMGTALAWNPGITWTKLSRKTKVFRVIVIVLLSWNMVQTARVRLKMDKRPIGTAPSPLTEWDYLQAHARPFWGIVDKSLARY